MHHKITNLLAIAVAIKMNYRGWDSNTDMEYWKESFTRNRELAKLFSIIDLERLSEGELEHRFGQEYCEYKSNVGMFVPRLHWTPKK